MTAPYFGPTDKPHEQQVPPLRCAPVGMTILLHHGELSREIIDFETKLSSRPERSVVEGPAGTFCAGRSRRKNALRFLKNKSVLLALLDRKRKGLRASAGGEFLRRPFSIHYALHLLALRNAK